MTAFYVGQGIKKVRGIHIGYVGTVCGFIPNDPDGYTLLVIVKGGWIGNVTGQHMDECVPAQCHPGHWEPIIPEGLESLTEINALYEPEPAKAGA